MFHQMARLRQAAADEAAIIAAQPVQAQDLAERDLARLLGRSESAADAAAADAAAASADGGTGDDLDDDHEWYDPRELDSFDTGEEPVPAGFDNTQDSLPQMAPDGTNDGSVRHARIPSIARERRTSIPTTAPTTARRGSLRNSLGTEQISQSADASPRRTGADGSLTSADDSSGATPAAVPEEPPLDLSAVSAAVRQTQSAYSHLFVAALAAGSLSSKAKSAALQSALAKRAGTKQLLIAAAKRAAMLSSAFSPGTAKRTLQARAMPGQEEAGTRSATGEIRPRCSSNQRRRAAGVATSAGISTRISAEASAAIRAAIRAATSVATDKRRAAHCCCC